MIYRLVVSRQAVVDAVISVGRYAWRYPLKPLMVCNELDSPIPMFLNVKTLILGLKRLGWVKGSQMALRGSGRVTSATTVGS